MDTIVLVLRGGEFTAPVHSAAISPDGRWIRVRAEALTPLAGAAVPDQPQVAVSVAAYGRSWAVIAGGAVATAEQAVETIRNAQPAMALAERLLAGLQPAQVPAAPAADGDADLDDD